MLAVPRVALHAARLVTGRCRRSQHRPLAAANVRLTLQPVYTIRVALSARLDI